MQIFVKYQWLTLICIVCFSSICAAQNIDSLELVAAKGRHDTTRINALLLLCGRAGTENILKYAEPALKLSEENLKRVLSGALHKFYLKASASALGGIGFYYLQYSNSSKALPFLKRELKIFEQLKEERGIASALIRIGNAQIELKDGKLALDYYKKAMLICEKIKDSVILASLLSNIGTIYSNEGRLAIALDYMHRSLKINIERKDSSGISRQLAAISLIYQKQGNYKKAQQYNFEALKIEEGKRSKDQFMIVRMLHNVGSVYMSSNDFKNAEPFFTRALKISEKLDYKPGISVCFTGLANVYLNEGQQDKALEYFMRGLKINQEAGNKLGLCISYHNICDFYLITGHLSKALEYGTKGLAMARKLDYPGKISICAKLLYQIYKQQNKPAQALKMYELHIMHRDSINSEDARKAALTSQLQYEFDKKEAALKAEQDKAILRFEKERANMEASSEREKLLILTGFTSTGLVASILLLILLRNRSRKKQKQIEFEKSVLELEQQALRAQMNPHFIFNAINSIQNYILKREKQEAYDYLAKFSRLIRLVLNNSQEKDLVLNQELEMIELYVELEQLRFKSFEFHLDISDRVNQFEIIVPSMLIQPYVENAICHGLMNLENERKGILNLSVTHGSGVLKIVIQDNGIGRERAKKYKKADAHTSLGMAFTEQRLHVINKMQQYEKKAKVEITDLYNQNMQGIGTKVEIFIPVDGK